MSDIDDRKTALVSALVSYNQMLGHMNRANPGMVHDFSYYVIAPLCRIAQSIEQAEQRATQEPSK